MNPDLPSGRDEDGRGDGDGDFLDGAAGDGDTDVVGSPDEGAMGGACGWGGAGGGSDRAPNSCVTEDK